MNLSDTHVQALISSHSYCFISAKISCDMFQAVLDNVDCSKDEIDYDEEVSCEEDIEPSLEWLLLVVSKYAANLPL